MGTEASRKNYAGKTNRHSIITNTLNDLLAYGGFPEPFLKQSERHLRVWNLEKMERFFKEDIRELTLIQDISSMQILSEILPDRAGGILSLNSLREYLQVSHRAISHWMTILEEFYFCFRVFPYQSKKYRALKKEPKLYLWDQEGYKCELHYLRDQEKREVDFLVTIDKKPWFAVEVKQSTGELHKNLLYFRDRLSIPHCYQVVLNSKEDYIKDNVRVMPVSKFLSALL